MSFQAPGDIDIERMSREISEKRILEIKNRINEQVSTWLYGLDEAIRKRVEALFILLPYSDKVQSDPSQPKKGTKRLGQAHLMFRGKTGIGKTDLEQSIALSIDAMASRIQGDPEMMPRHITGGSRFVQNLRGERRVVFEPGPLLSHLVLVDEANRMRQNTFSSAVEAMEERSLTPRNEYVDEKDLVVKALPFFPITGVYTDFSSPRFFQVALTENPFGDEEGTYPNPQALLDRITLSINIGRPNFGDEKKIRAKNVVGKSISPVTNLAELLACAHYIFNNVRLLEKSPANDYITRLLRNTNPPSSRDKNEGVNDPPELVEFVRENIQIGASPRVNFHLEAAARVRAFFSGSMVIKPEHVKAVAPEVIAHRLRLAPGLELTTTKEEIFQKVLDLTELPEW